MSRQALVVGAGVAGLSAAIALDRAGYDVEVVDRAPALEPAGAALSLWPNAMWALSRLGADARIRTEAAPIGRMLLRTQAGTTLLDRRVTDAFLPTRALLQAALLQRLGAGSVRLGTPVTGLGSAREGELRLEDGRVLRADLLVIADGIRSALAQALNGPPRPCGYGGVVALSDRVDDAGLDGVAAEYWGRHERFGVCDLGGGRRYWFHMRTGDEDAAPPSLAALRERARDWPEPVGRALDATPPARLIPWAIHAKPPPRRLAAGRAVLVGDAAHPMEPNLGQGACQALEDAAALGEAATRVAPEDVPALFERMRLGRVRGVVRRAAEGGGAVHGPAAMQALMRAGLLAMPARVKEAMVGGVQRAPA